MADVRFLATDKAPAAIGPYSQGVKADKLIIVSGQLPIKAPSTELITDIHNATMTCLENIEAIVINAGGKKESIIKCSVFMKNMDDFAVMNKAYAEFFGNHKPARAAIQVAKLPKDAVLEIEAFAYLD